MTQVAEKKMLEWTPEEKKELPSRYGCDLLFERTTLQQIKDPSLPSDAYIVTYQVNGETFIDLCRGKKVNIFDMYYDKFGSGTVQRIDWGYGRVNPRLWGSKKASEGKKRK
jgi:hypothetical protein